MRVNRAQIRRILLEFSNITHRDIVEYLKAQAREYARDGALTPPGVQELLMDDFMDNIGAYADLSPEYQELIDSLAGMPGASSILEGFAATAEEEALKVNKEAGISLVTDQAFWEERGISTGEELAKSLLSSTYSDYYKDLHGIRPRWMDFSKMSVEEIQAEIEKLDKEAEKMYVDDIGIDQMRDAARAVGDDMQDIADYLGISVEDATRIRADIDQGYEDRHYEDQDMWIDPDQRVEDIMMDAVEANPEDIPDEFLEYETVPIQQGMGRRPAGSKAQRRMESAMRVTRSQLRRIIQEGIDIINYETGELLVFEDDWEERGGTAPEAAARDALKRLKITPVSPPDGWGTPDPDVEDIWVDPSDYAVLDTEFHGKRVYRKNKKERERLDIDNLLKRLDQWAADASSDYAGDNPGIDMQGVAWDLAASAEYSFERDEWDELILEFDDYDALITYIADMIA